MAAQQIIKHYKKPWQLMVSVCLTRMNVLSKELTGIQKEYATLMNTIELEQSVLNDYEYHKKMLHDSTQKVSKKKMSEAEENQIVDASRQLAGIQDQEDIWAADLAKVEVAPKHSELNAYQNSLHRHLDSILHMVVPDSELLNENTMLYPYMTLAPGESLRQASERILTSYGVQANSTLYLSNAPIGVVKIRFNENEERGQLYQGAKIFFTKVQLTSTESMKSNEGDIKPPLKWLILDELEQSSHTDYFRRIQKFV